MLDRKDVDAVIVATPGHWHALQAIDACRAGKDLYVQKPMTLHLAEALALKRAVEKHQRISQVGTQIHAGDNYRRVVEWVRSGKLGAISVVRTFLMGNLGPQGIGPEPAGSPPAGLDWDRWIGPAPTRPYSPLAVRGAGIHTHFMDFGGGWTPGMAPHIIDLAYWALDLGMPTLTSAAGGRFLLRGAGDVPDSQEVLWQFPGAVVTWMTSLVNSYGFDFLGGGPITGRLGAYFHGTNGTLMANYGTHRVVPEGDRMKDPKPPAPSIPPSPGHEREWLDAIKTRKQPSCHVGYHYKLDAAIGLARLAFQLKRSIRFDPESEKIVGDEEAARLARPIYREPWKFPEEYLEAKTA
jgi:predicted dehydrogenase